jgi:hypothetical protein
VTIESPHPEETSTSSLLTPTEAVVVVVMVPPTQMRITRRHHPGEKDEDGEEGKDDEDDGVDEEPQTQSPAFPPHGKPCAPITVFRPFFFFWYVTCNGSAWLTVRGEAQGSEKVVGEHRAQR